MWQDAFIFELYFARAFLLEITTCVTLRGESKTPSVHGYIALIGRTGKKIINEDKDLKYLLLSIIGVILRHFTYIFSKLQVSSPNNFLYVNCGIALLF